MTVPVVYRNGAFVPTKRCSFAEGTEAFVVVGPSDTEVPLITDPGERRRLLSDIVEDMKKNPLPPDSPRLTRDQMHERR
jgi:predicted DNA-binding antitoxin AbrB/MazE fold protein